MGYFGCSDNLDWTQFSKLNLCYMIGRVKPVVHLLDCQHKNDFVHVVGYVGAASQNIDKKIIKEIWFRA